MNSTPEAAFFGLIAILTLISLWRELPLQYVITVALVMFAISAATFWILKQPHWWLPLIVLNSRGVSRLLLSKWKDRAYYGWWVIGLTCLLSAVLAPRWITLALALLMQIAAVPWLIKRRPGTDAPSYFPLINWLLLAAWMLVMVGRSVPVEPRHERLARLSGDASPYRMESRL